MPTKTLSDAAKSRKAIREKVFAKAGRSLSLLEVRIIHWDYVWQAQVTFTTNSKGSGGRNKGARPLILAPPPFLVSLHLLKAFFIEKWYQNVVPEHFATESQNSEVPEN